MDEHIDTEVDLSSSTTRVSSGGDPSAVVLDCPAVKDEVKEVTPEKLELSRFLQLGFAPAKGDEVDPAVIRERKQTLLDSFSSISDLARRMNEIENSEVRAKVRHKFVTLTVNECVVDLSMSTADAASLISLIPTLFSFTLGEKVKRRWINFTSFVGSVYADTDQAEYYGDVVEGDTGDPTDIEANVVISGVGGGPTDEGPESAVADPKEKQKESKVDVCAGCEQRLACSRFRSRFYCDPCIQGIRQSAQLTQSSFSLSLEKARHYDEETKEFEKEAIEDVTRRAAQLTTGHVVNDERAEVATAAEVAAAADPDAEVEKENE